MKDVKDRIESIIAELKLPKISYDFDYISDIASLQRTIHEENIQHPNIQELKFLLDCLLDHLLVIYPE
jgi:hypothetical protein